MSTRPAPNRVPGVAAKKWTYEEIIERSDELAARFEAGGRLLSDLLSRDEHAAFVRSLDDDSELATT